MDRALSDFAKDLDIRQTNHLPVIAAFCRELRIDQIINRLVPTSIFWCKSYHVGDYNKDAGACPVKSLEMQCFFERT